MDKQDGMKHKECKQNTHTDTQTHISTDTQTGTHMTTTQSETKWTNRLNLRLLMYLKHRPQYTITKALGQNDSEP